jgi:hypothetical protein
MKAIYQFPELVNSGLHFCRFVSAHPNRRRPSYRETLVLQHLLDFVQEISRRICTRLLHGKKKWLLRDSSIRDWPQASFAITVTFFDVVAFVRSLEVFGFGNGFILSLENLPIDLRVCPANMVVSHRCPLNSFQKRDNTCPVRPVRP